MLGKSNQYHDLRAALLRAGWTLRSWALAQGYAVQTVYGAAKGTRAGVKSTKIRTELERITNVPKKRIA